MAESARFVEVDSETVRSDGIEYSVSVETRADEWRVRVRPGPLTSRTFRGQTAFHDATMCAVHIIQTLQLKG